MSSGGEDVLPFSPAGAVGGENYRKYPVLCMQLISPKTNFALFLRSWE